MSTTEKTLERVRHELKFRICETVSTEYLTPKMIRVKVTSPDLEGFKSLAYDDHVKLFFATEGSELALPVIGPNGLQYPDHLPMPDALAAGKFVEVAMAQIAKIEGVDGGVYECLIFDGITTFGVRVSTEGDQVFNR